MINAEETFPIRLRDGTETPVRRLGQGPAVLFSHGAGFACDAFSPFVHELAQSFEVYCVDLRGHGIGPQTDVATFSLPLLTDDTADIANALHQRRGGAPLLGVFHSIAAILALRAQADDNGLFDAIVGFEPPLAAIGEHADAFRQGARVLANRALSRARTFDSPNDLAHRYVRGRVLVGASEAAALILADALLETGEDGLQHLRCDRQVEAKVYSTNTDFGLWHDLGQIGCKGLIMCGELPGSPGYPERVAPKIAELAGFELQRLHGLSHLGWIESPGPAARRVADFLRGLKGADAGSGDS
jgi:pimeloyl-ACP methyl ester carboxylesterase